MSRVIQRTEALAFFSCNPQHEKLFMVRDGIPAMNALEQASCFLDSARTIAGYAGQSNDAALMFAATYLIDLAKAVIDATVEGSIQEGCGHE